MQLQRFSRRPTSVQTTHLVILTAVTATILAGYGMCSLMLLTRYGAEGSPYENNQVAVNGNSLVWETRTLKGNRRLLMSITSSRHMLKQQQATAQRIQQQWAQFWASDIPQGKSPWLFLLAVGAIVFRHANLIVYRTTRGHHSTCGIWCEHSRLSSLSAGCVPGMCMPRYV
jgi:hypothetical protein